MHIEGEYDDGNLVVRLDGRVLDPARSQKVWNHSPDGFAWGYGGSGPAQLALAILLAAGLSDDDAVRLHQPFKWAFIAPLPQGRFSISVDVDGWIKAPNVVAAARPSITCPTCHLTSYNPSDIRENYCGFCHQFHGSTL